MRQPALASCPRRLRPDIPFPPYAFVPGRHPRPTGAPAADGGEAFTPEALHQHALDLFNHGYYWEAHGAWEDLWRLHGRSSHDGRLLKGLIILAAAGVKARQGNRRGLLAHARRAAEIFRGLGGAPATSLGLSPGVLAGFAEEILAEPPVRLAAAGAPPEIVFRSALTLA